MGTSNVGKDSPASVRNIQAAAIEEEKNTPKPPSIGKRTRKQVKTAPTPP